MSVFLGNSKEQMLSNVISTSTSKDTRNLHEVEARSHHESHDRKTSSIEGLERKPSQKPQYENVSQRRITKSFSEKINLRFTSEKEGIEYQSQLKLFPDNKISTTKYNLITWLPKSLLVQFFKAANIYFLLVTILYFFPLSPKEPVTQTFTFVLVILFSMVKEAVEDIARYNQDKEINNLETNVFNYTTKKFEPVLWYELRVGDIVKIYRDKGIPADILFVHSSFKSGLCFVDTKNLDGETNLKEKLIAPALKEFSENELEKLDGNIICDVPNEYLDSWEAGLAIPGLKITTLCSLKQLLLKGSVLKNTEYIIGIVAYTGHNTKIMKNAKDPPIKMTNVTKVMNKLLISVFIFLMIVCTVFSACNLSFRGSHNEYLNRYIPIDGKFGFIHFLTKFLTYVVAYSHVIPISLYVALEMVKIALAQFIFYDEEMYDLSAEKPSKAKTTELIEELGQAEFVFSDKTGTLTQNIMEFKKCAIDEKIYGDNPNKDKDISDSDFHINRDTEAAQILHSHSHFKNTEKFLVTQFFRLLSVCHSAVCEKEENPKIAVSNRMDVTYKYSSSSPDEVALICGAKNMGFVFENKTTDTIEVRNMYSNELEVWELLVELPFDSTRKRMTVIVRPKGDVVNVFVMTKGADNVMLPRCKLTDNVKARIRNQLYQFSSEGLRTLVLGQKQITKDYFDIWNEKYTRCSLSNDKNKESYLNELFEEIEVELTYVGCTAIEDKLQDQVPETIELLMKSNIKVWVLTGDKKETALSIGRSCRLIEEIGKNELNFTTNKEFVNPAEIEAKLNYEENKFNLHTIEDLNDVKNMTFSVNYYMIVDGVNLIEILKEEALARKFFKVGLICKSVICCRVSPKQKSQVVVLAKAVGLGKWVTLSVGDGANDVPMIMEANIGVGIQGKEGTQAVRSADYAICQFKFLQRLILLHGRYGYIRISSFICYYFYKNILLVFLEIAYPLYSGFSGTLFFPDLLPNMYNALWTSWPCIFAFCLEKDVSEDKFKYFPILYQAGHLRHYFNLRVFWKWIFYALCHGLVIYFVVVAGVPEEDIFVGRKGDHWWMTTIIFTSAIHVVSYKILIETRYWTKLSVGIILASIIFYYLCLLLVSIPELSIHFQPQLCSKFFDMAVSAQFWSYVISLPLIVILVDIGVTYIYATIYPTPLDILVSEQQMQDTLSELDFKKQHTNGSDLKSKLTTKTEFENEYL